MKKNFLMVAALLIAAMLMVVSCTQEVAPKNELVKASFSVGFGKDITITDDIGKNITYVYSVTPEWNTLTQGAEIYGEVTNKPITDKKSITDPVSESIGYLTPGLWKVTVDGYTNYQDDENKGNHILSGENTVYFANSTNKNSVTVLVSPVEDSGSATVNVTLQMQDLGDQASSIKLKFDHISSEYKKEVVITDRTEGSGDKNAYYEYKQNGIRLEKVGFYTVTVTVPGYDNNGGYVRTFLAVNGGAVDITGSVYPSEFINSSMTIVSVSLNNENTKLENLSNKNESGKYYNQGNIEFKLNDSNTYLSKDQINALKKNAGVTDVVASTTYNWYLNSAPATGNRTDSESEVKYTVSITTPGVYSLSCEIIYQVKISYGENAPVTKTFYGTAKSEEFIVE